MHIEEVALLSLTFQSEPHCEQCDIWSGGELAKEVAFTFMFLYYYEQAHFVMSSGLLFILFGEAVSFCL